MNSLYKNCLARWKEIAALASASGLCSWDQETMMPPHGINARSEQESALAGVIHEKLTDPAMGKMLRKLSMARGLSSNEKVCVREWLRDYEHSVKVPPELVRELARVTSLAQSVWIEARKKSNFGMFAPWLDKIMALERKEADALGYKGTRYDALLDNYEPEMTVAELDPIIEKVRAGLVPIVRAITNSKTKVNGSILEKRYPEAEQEKLCKELIPALGADVNAMRLDRSAHPFCCGIAPGDVRITTRYDEHWLPQALYGVIHESGHALYDQGLSIKLYGTPLGEPVSVGVHESQSRFFENIVGRGLPFVKFIFPKLRRHFSKTLRNTNAETFYRAINRVKPSAIRVEADEVTYNLHVALRYEIEKNLINGNIRARELPKLWNKRMQEYFGITPKNDAEGVLQDTHWAGGMVGYFPTYLLGNIYSAQLWYALKNDIHGVEALIAKGKFTPILNWLRKKIHQHGRRYKPAELIERATGQPPNPKFFLDYLKEKYGKIYCIEKW